MSVSQMEAMFRRLVSHKETQLRHSRLCSPTEAAIFMSLCLAQYGGATGEGLVECLGLTWREVMGVLHDLRRHGYACESEGEWFATALGQSEYEAALLDWGPLMRDPNDPRELREIFPSPEEPERQDRVQAAIDQAALEFAGDESA